MRELFNQELPRTWNCLSNQNTQEHQLGKNQKGTTSHKTLLITNHIREKSLSFFLTTANIFHKETEVEQVKETTQLTKA